MRSVNDFESAAVYRRNKRRNKASGKRAHAVYLQRLEAAAFRVAYTEGYSLDDAKELVLLRRADQRFSPRKQARDNAQRLARRLGIGMNKARKLMGLDWRYRPCRR